MKLTKAHKERLITLLQEGDAPLSPTRITGSSVNSVILEGCSLPGYFDGSNLFIWRKCSRSSGYRISIDDLQRMQEIVRAWHREITSEEVVS